MTSGRRRALDAAASLDQERIGTVSVMKRLSDAVGADFYPVRVRLPLQTLPIAILLRIFRLLDPNHEWSISFALLTAAVITLPIWFVVFALAVRYPIAPSRYTLAAVLLWLLIVAITIAPPLALLASRSVG